ncbi:MAG: glycosyltransferase family 4 protein [Desulfobacteraceae bacterium]|nr:glycosyltransferase family 4 protein [Desulfobacteraceae bacterium]
MHENPKLTSFFPATGKHVQNPPDLLGRLRRWPAYEQTGDERAHEIGHWRAEVRKRQATGAARRVLFVHGQLPGETGSGVYLQQISAESIRQGIDLYVLSAGYKKLDSSDIKGVPDDRIFTCRFTPEGERPREGAVRTPISGMSVVMPYPVLAYRDRTDEELIDLLTVFGNTIAHLVHRLQPDVIHVDHLWFLNGLARLIAPWIPLVASAHGTAHKLIVDTPRFRELVIPCVSSADHVCAISPESVDECADMFEIPKARISIEGYGYEPELFHYKPVERVSVIREILGIETADIDHVIISVGKFVDWKGFKELTRAIAILRHRGFNLMAIIVGEGDPESRADLEAFIVQHKMDEYIRLPGKVERTVLPGVYRAGDVYVLPSHVEPYGLVLMEALACGTPAVSGNAGGVPSYVPQALRDEGFAVLVDPIKLTGTGEALPGDRDTYARNLADGIEAVLNKKIRPDDRLRIAEAMKPLSWGRLVKSLSGIYDQVLEKALSGRSR